MGGGNQCRKFYAALAEGLIAYAEQEFRDSRPVDGGGTEREHSEAAARIRAGLPKAKGTTSLPAAKLTCPPAAVHVWQWFAEILGGASGGGFGPAMITWPDVLAWAEITGEAPEPWEVRLIMHLSRRRAEIAADHAREDQDRARRRLGERNRR